MLAQIPQNVSQWFSADFTSLRSPLKNHMRPPLPACSRSPPPPPLSSASSPSPPSTNCLSLVSCLFGRKKMNRSLAPNILHCGSSWELQQSQAAAAKKGWKEQRGWWYSWGHSFSQVPATAAFLPLMDQKIIQLQSLQKLLNKIISFPQKHYHDCE